MASLIFLKGDEPGRHYPLGKRTTVIGRDEGVALQLNDDRVSRKHCQIRFEAADSSFHLLDMQSTHGTLLNGRRVSSDRVLAEGDEISAGDVTLLFTLNDFENAAAAMSHWKTAGQRAKPTMTD